MEEAKIISEAVREHFRHRREESIGVVAMSAEQRLQFERTIEMLAKEDAVFQEWLERMPADRNPCSSRIWRISRVMSVMLFSFR
jgi:hypothetical protein